MSIHNIHEYRKSKAMVKELEKILTILDATQASLTSYKKYIPVQYILGVISQYKPLLEITLEQRKIMVETKGEKR